MTTIIDEQYMYFENRVFEIDDSLWDAMNELWGMVDRELLVRASITDDMKN